METQSSQNLQTKLVHATRQQSANDPIKLVFAIYDEQGVEEVLTAEIPDANELFEWTQSQGYIFQPGRRSMSSSSVSQLRSRRTG